MVWGAGVEGTGPLFDGLGAGVEGTGPLFDGLGGRSRGDWAAV